MEDLKMLAWLACLRLCRPVLSLQTRLVLLVENLCSCDPRGNECDLACVLWAPQNASTVTGGRSHRDGIFNPHPWGGDPHLSVRLCSPKPTRGLSLDTKRVFFFSDILKMSPSWMRRCILLLLLFLNLSFAWCADVVMPDMSAQIKHDCIAGLLFPLMFHAWLIAALINRKKWQVNTDRINSRRDVLIKEKPGWISAATCG